MTEAMFYVVGLVGMTALHDRKKRAEEAGTMSTYDGDIHEYWEFKIVRSPVGAFRKAKTIRRLCVEESEYGWELAEKFDNGRIRMRRTPEERMKDAARSGDAYRVHWGWSANQVRGAFLAVALLVGLVLAFRV